MSSATRGPRIYRLDTDGPRLRRISICVVTVFQWWISSLDLLKHLFTLPFFHIFTELYCKTKRDSVQKSWTETDGAPAYVQLLSHYVIRPTASRALLGLERGRERWEKK